MYSFIILKFDKLSFQTSSRILALCGEKFFIGAINVGITGS